MVAYLFNDYWEDIGTIKSFFEANLALAQQARGRACAAAPCALWSAAVRGCLAQDLIARYRPRQMNLIGF